MVHTRYTKMLEQGGGSQRIITDLKRDVMKLKATIEELEEQNKKLKASHLEYHNKNIRDLLDIAKGAMKLRATNDELEEENKKLKEKNETLTYQRDSFEGHATETIVKLTEEKRISTCTVSTAVDQIINLTRENMKLKKDVKCGDCFTDFCHCLNPSKDDIDYWCDAHEQSDEIRDYIKKFSRD